MAGLFYTGPFECNNPSCAPEITSYFLKLSLNSAENHRIFMLLSSSFPLLNLPTTFGSSNWKGLQYFLKQPFTNLSFYISQLLTQSINPQYLTHFFEDLKKILQYYIIGQESIDFAFHKFRIHEKCSIEKCLSLPCCGGGSCEHEKAPENLKSVFHYADCSEKVEALVYSLMYLSKDLMVWKEYKNQIVRLLIQGSMCEKLQKSCLQVLLYLAEIQVDSIEDFELLEAPYIKHLAPWKILEVTKQALIKGHSCKKLVRHSIELFKAGNKYNDIRELEVVIRNKKAPIFAWMVIRNHFQDDLSSYIHSINSCITLSQHSSKKLKTFKGNSSVHDIELKDFHQSSQFLYFELLKEAIYNKDKDLLYFWLGISGNVYIEGIVEKTEEIRMFHSICGLIEPESFEEIKFRQYFKYRPINLSNFMIHTDLVQINHILWMIPAHLMEFEDAFAVDYISRTFGMIFSGEIIEKIKGNFSVKALGVQVNEMIKSLIRLMKLLNDFNLEKGAECKFIVEFPSLCMYCAESCAEFCSSCGKAQFPIVFPEASIELPQSITGRQMVSLISKFTHRNASVKFDFKSIVSKCSEITTEFTHSCIKLILDPHILMLSLMLKHLEGPVFDHLPLNCITIPIKLIKIRTFECFPLFSKLYAQKLIKESKINVLNSSDIMVLMRIIISPCMVREVFDITVDCINLLYRNYGFNFNEIIDFIDDEMLMRWVISVTSSKDYFRRLLNEFDINLNNILIRFQPQLIITHNYEDILNTLVVFFSECQLPFQLFYTNIISEIAWDGNIDKLKTLEDLASRVLKGSEGQQISIHDIFTNIDHNYNIALMLLMTSLGLKEQTTNWIISAKFNCTPVNFLENKIDKFLNAFQILTQVFYSTEGISQNVAVSSNFGYIELLNIAHLMEELALPNEIYKTNSLIGLGKLFMYYLRDDKHQEYLIHKVICICTQLLPLDIALMLEMLRQLLDEPKCASHFIAIMSLGFIGRNHNGLRVIGNFLDKNKNLMRRNIGQVYFMAFYNLIDPKFTLFDRIHRVENLTAIYPAMFNSLCQAISINFPILQYSALSLVPELFGYFKAKNSMHEIPVAEIALALNKAASLQTSRDNIKELPFPLGLEIDKTIGIIGAISDIYIRIPSHPTGKTNLASNLSTCEHLYLNSEKIFLSKQISTGSNEEVVLHLKKLYIDSLQIIEDPSYNRMKSLRSWTQLLIRTHEFEKYYPAIPLIQVNLELIGFILPKVLKKSANKTEYFCEYITDFFKNSNAGHRRLMMKIVEKCPDLYERLPIDMILAQLIDLQEYPKALSILESSIRKRIESNDQRYSPMLIEPASLEWCRKVYSGLYKLRYIESIPKQCEDYKLEEIELQSLFKSGNFLLISSQASEKINKYYIGACWRVGNILKLDIGGCWRAGSMLKHEIDTDIESVLVYVLSQANLPQAISSARNTLIAKSTVRSAAYSQAYEHILIQHIFENLTQITGGKSTYQDLSARNELINNKFEYREITLRSSLFMYRKLKLNKNIIRTFRDLFKNAALHKEFEYCKNLIIEMKLMHRELIYPIVNYYEIKLQVMTETLSQNTKSRVKRLWMRTPGNLEVPPENGGLTNAAIKSKLALIYIRIKITEDIKNLQKLTSRYLRVDERLYEAQRVYIEKSYAVLAGYFDKFLYFEITQENAHSALIAADLYCKSLVHGHSLYYHSVTRLLSLFIGICSTSQETPELSRQMLELAKKLPLFIWADRVNQVISATGSLSTVCKDFIKTILIRLLIKHPSQMLWYIFPMLTSAESAEYSRESQSKLKLFEGIIKDYQLINGVRDSVVLGLKEFFNTLVKLCNIKKQNIIQSIMNVEKLEIAMPIKENFLVQEFKKNEYCYGKDLPGFVINPVLIKGFSDKLTLMSSKAAPAKISMFGTDGIERYFLCKYDKSSDMRKESRSANIFDYINRLFSKYPDTQRMQVRLPTYCIFNIGKGCGVVEWVPNTESLKSIIINQNKMNKVVEFTSKIAKGSHENKPVWDKIQQLIRPKFYKFFDSEFSDANSAFKARTVYTRSLAAWSMVGYIIGLGDRHTENILMIKKTAELLFIDFECIFNMGKTLPKAEIVPFRLTPELHDALGLFFEEGEFLNTCEIVLNCLKQNKRSLMSQFESFITDPLSIKIKNPEIDLQDIDLENTLRIVEARLDGKKNFKEKKFKNTRLQVESVVKEATDPENLRKMYFGWSPWF